VQVGCSGKLWRGGFVRTQIRMQSLEKFPFVNVKFACSSLFRGGLNLRQREFSPFRFSEHLNALFASLHAPDPESRSTRRVKHLRERQAVRLNSSAAIDHQQSEIVYKKSIRMYHGRSRFRLKGKDM